MITNDLNAELINAIREKTPLRDKIANTLMDILCIGKEAAYRRLRGEVPFTLAEAAAITRQLGISMDAVMGTSAGSSAVFDINIMDDADTFETYYSILEKQVKLFDSLKKEPDAELVTSSNIIPQTLSMKHDLLSRFRLFKWMYQIKNVKCKHFESLQIPAKLVKQQQEFAASATQMHSTCYIWDSMIFQHMVNDIQYFSDIGLLSDESKSLIKEELLLLVDELEELAARGKSKSGNEVKIYISSINFEATYSYVHTASLQLSLIRIYSINSITTQDSEVFQSLKAWIKSLKKFSTLISESGEMQRTQFFRQQREIIGAL